MMDGANVRVCIPGDETVLSLLGQATFLESFAGMVDGRDLLDHCTNKHAPGVYRDWLEDRNVRIWMAEIPPGNAPVGYLVLTPPDLPVADMQSGDLEIKRVYILHRFQGTGLGKALMEAAFIHAKKIKCRRVLLGVYSRNTGAIAFYRKLGFIAVGKRTFRVGKMTSEDTVFALTL